MSVVETTIQLEMGVATDVGRVRELNEDTVLAVPLQEGPGNPWQLSAVLAVADGMGGHQAGEVASRLAGDMVRKAFLTPHEIPVTGANLTPDGLMGRLSEVIQEVNRAVYSLGDGVSVARPGTTLTICLVGQANYYVGHVGDSRAYLVSRGTIIQITEDDSWVAEALRRGQLTEEEAKDSPFQNQLTKSIGIAPDVEPSIYHGRWDEDDVLVLCSDGLTEYVPPAEMLQLAANYTAVQEACEEMVRLANDRGGHDNISVVAARAGKGMGNGGRRKPPTWPPAGVTAAAPTTPLTPLIIAPPASARPAAPPTLAPMSRRAASNEPETVELPTPPRFPAQAARPSPARSVSSKRKADPLKILLGSILGVLGALAGVWFGTRSQQKGLVAPASMSASTGVAPANPTQADVSPGAAAAGGQKNGQTSTVPSDGQAGSIVPNAQTGAGPGTFGVIIRPEEQWHYLSIACAGGIIRASGIMNSVELARAGAKVILRKPQETQAQIADGTAEIICVDSENRVGALNNQQDIITLDNVQPGHVYTLILKGVPPHRIMRNMATFYVVPVKSPLQATSILPRRLPNLPHSTLIMPVPHANALPDQSSPSKGGYE